MWRFEISQTFLLKNKCSKHVTLLPLRKKFCSFVISVRCLNDKKKCVLKKRFVFLNFTTSSSPMEGRRSLRTRKTVVPKVEPKPPSKVKKTPKKRQKIVLPISSSGESSFELTTTSVQRTSSRPVRKSTRRKTTTARPPSSDEDFELESPPSKKKKPVSRRKTIAAVSKTTTSKTKPTTNLVLKRARKKKAVILSPEEAIQAAMDRFHASSVPDELPCREQQLEAITSFVEQKLDDGEGG